MLPSKYAPEGLSKKKRSTIITTGDKPEAHPIEYIVRKVEDRIDTANSTGSDQDIEMVPVDDDKEVQLIYEYMRRLRDENSTQEDDYSMDFETDDLESPPEPDVRYDIQTPSINNQSTQYSGGIAYLVVDTNFVLSHLNIVDDLKKVAPTFHLKIQVPQMVMLELDGLKKSTEPAKSSPEGTPVGLSGKSMGHLARWANDWIYKALANVKTPVSGQRISEKIDRHATKDDAILDYCLYLQKYKPRSLVVLLSNDKNLCLKALTHEILTVSFRKSMTGQLIAETIFAELANRVPGTSLGATEETHVARESVEPIETQPKVPTEYVHKDKPLPLSQAARQIYLEIEKVVVHAIKQTIQHSYGEDIIMLRDYHPEQINTILAAADIIERFWISVFSEYCRGIKREKLHSLSHIPVTRTQLEAFIDQWVSVLDGIYGAVMNSGDQAALALLVQRWNRIKEDSYT